jgi:hypothetical protein
MSDITIGTQFGPFRKTHATDATDTSFAARSPKVTEPTGDGIIAMGFGGRKTNNGLMLLIVGTGANNAVIDGMRVISWRRLLGDGNTVKDLWVPHVLAEFSATLGNVTGAANGALGTSYFFADTISLVTNMGNANVSNEIVSPQNDTPAHILLDAKGAEKVEVLFDLGASATGGNCLYAKI